MGLYIEGPAKGKAQYIVDTFDGMIVSKDQAAAAIGTKAVIIVVDNGPFEAAGLVLNLKEFNAFTRPDDYRPKSFILMDLDVAKKEVGID